MTENTDFNKALCDFLDYAPTPFHAVLEMAKRLKAAGFVALSEGDSWLDLEAGRYYVTRNDSSIIAFNLPAKALSTAGIRLVGAHTDSPCLKVKPNPEKINAGLVQVGVEVYGGALLNPWFDRDLSLAGRVNYLDSNETIQTALVNFNKPIAVIPSLAIHLDREANENRNINRQLHLPPVLMLESELDVFDFRMLLQRQLTEQDSALDIVSVLDYEISLYDVQPASLTGLKEDFISSARLDNLLSCFAGLTAIIDSNNEHASLLVCNDHEEVGSVSSSGAQGSFLESVLLRLTGNAEDFHRMITNSMMISADNAHAIHPNYLDKHDEEHGPKLNGGLVIKTNANQRYATNSETSAIFRNLCRQADVPVQDFVVRSDMGCGSTIGPVTSSNLGVKTLDIGVPTYAMHSIREMAGSKDSYRLKKVIEQFYNH
jgi:aspartyl aminopeptidase